VDTVFVVQLQLFGVLSAYCSRVVENLELFATHWFLEFCSGHFAFEHIQLFRMICKKIVFEIMLTQYLLIIVFIY